MASDRPTARPPSRVDAVSLLSNPVEAGLLRPSQPWSVVTCTADGLAHAVPDATLADVAAGAGRMLAVCGRWIVPGALTSPVGPPCRLCPLDADAGGRAGPTRPARNGRTTRRSRFWW